MPRVNHIGEVLHAAEVAAVRRRLGVLRGWCAPLETEDQVSRPRRIEVETLAELREIRRLLASLLVRLGVPLPAEGQADEQERSRARVAGLVEAHARRARMKRPARSSRGS